MKTYDLSQVTLTGGYLLEKQELNRKTTIHAVYDRFLETGRIGAFRFAYGKGDAVRPHFYWDSDVAKWMEGAAYILQKHPDTELEAKVDSLVEQIRLHQEDSGYFNIYFTVCEPNQRFTRRGDHELYCAGHLIEAAVAYAEATGKTAFLDCMERYAEHVARVFLDEDSAAFRTPGHEEIELALVRLYRHTGKRRYLDLALHFLNARGGSEKEHKTDNYDQSHLPVRDQKEAVGHAVRALYLFTGMIYAASETGDAGLLEACRTLWEDMVNHKLYITGGLGSSSIGECFTSSYDLPNDVAYSETCAAIAMLYFSNGMLAMENNARYADVIEQALYNGLLSGLSQDGTAFFYENPLEINLSEQFETRFGKRRLPITQRKVCFDCSCCPPNLNRLLASLNNYLYGLDGTTLYINQFAASTLQDGAVSCTMETDYPRTGTVTLRATGTRQLGIRIPGWCTSFTLSKPYILLNGYALVENDGSPIEFRMDMTPQAVFADCRVLRDAGKACIRRGPVVYCAEGVDNPFGLHSYVIPSGFICTELPDSGFDLPCLELSCKRLLPLERGLYSTARPELVSATLRLIPYNAFANRGDSDMLVWFPAQL